MYVYMQVTSDKYEFPIHICDYVAELSRVSGSTKENIRNSISKVEAGKRKRGKYLRVDIGDWNAATRTENPL